MWLCMHHHIVGSRGPDARKGGCNHSSSTTPSPSTSLVQTHLAGTRCAAIHYSNAARFHPSYASRLWTPAKTSSAQAWRLKEGTFDVKMATVVLSEMYRLTMLLHPLPEPE
mmetsp:Transcript_142041/g.247454  ORF Transcript_142041/g.247454 Transcript_142041/m.247454 type:complete len:111 (+) Transcript_142041:205-537(+)